MIILKKQFMLWLCFCLTEWKYEKTLHGFASVSVFENNIHSTVLWWQKSFMKKPQHLSHISSREAVFPMLWLFLTILHISSVQIIIQIIQEQLRSARLF